MGDHQDWVNVVRSWEKAKFRFAASRRCASYAGGCEKLHFDVNVCFGGRSIDAAVTSRAHGP